MRGETLRCQQSFSKDISLARLQKTDLLRVGQRPKAINIEINSLSTAHLNSVINVGESEARCRFLPQKLKQLQVIIIVAAGLVVQIAHIDEYVDFTGRFFPPVR